jgi:muramoyltetrapeptide carboxypeptidase
MTEATLFAKPLRPAARSCTRPRPAPRTRSEVLRGGEWWESKGYRVKLAAGTYERDDYVAGDPRRRGEDLTELFADPEVDVVQTLQGGYGSAQAIPHSDFDVVKQNPKPFIGFSDITALHTAILSYTGLATVYGNGLVGVGDPETTEFSRDRGTTGNTRSASRSRRPLVRVFRPAARSAPLVGCLGCCGLTNALGDRSRRRDLLLRGRQGAALLSTASRRSWRIPASENVAVSSGMKDAIGRPGGPSDWGGPARSKTSPRSAWATLVPVLYELPRGHGKPRASAPLGVRYTLDAHRRILTLEEPPFRA